MRIDTGVTAGDDVSPYYDPMIAKLIAHGQSRAEAFARLADALGALELGPLVHNGPLLLRLCQEPDVLAMRHHTQWPIPTEPLAVPELAWPLATLWLASRSTGSAPWQQASGFRLGQRKNWTAAVQIGEEDRVLSLTECAGKLEWQGEQIPYALGADHIRLQHAGCWQRYPIQAVGARDFMVQLDGQRVSKGQPLLVLEAMKMEHVLKAEQDGVIDTLQCKAGEQVSQGAVLVRFTDADLADESTLKTQESST